MTDCFNSLDEAKQAAEFFPAGRIVPKRVMDIRHRKTGRNFKMRHLFTFTADVWMIRRGNAQLLFVHPGDGGPFMTLHNKRIGVHRHLKIIGNTYGERGNFLIGYQNENDLLEQINRIAGEQHD